MLKSNSSITDNKPKPDGISDKQSTKIHLLFCIRCRGDNKQAETNDKIQWRITKSEYKSIWLSFCSDYKSNDFRFDLT